MVSVRAAQFVDGNSDRNSPAIRGNSGLISAIRRFSEAFTGESVWDAADSAQFVTRELHYYNNKEGHWTEAEARERETRWQRERCGGSGGPCPSAGARYSRILQGPVLGCCLRTRVHARSWGAHPLAGGCRLKSRHHPAAGGAAAHHSHACDSPRSVVPCHQSRGGFLNLDHYFPPVCITKTARMELRPSW